MWARANSLRYLTFATLVFAAAAAESSDLLTGSLGRWLQQSAAPSLTKALTRHPMFKGETIRIVTLRSGKPSNETNRLNQAIQDYLKRRLLKNEGVRIAWDKAPQACSAPQNINFLLGVEIEQHGHNEHSLNIAMVDVTESIWVSGVNFIWEGRLSSAERRALDTPESAAAPGSLENPMQISEVDAISEFLRDRLECTLPGGLDGDVYLPAPAEADLVRITRGVERELATSAIANVTRDAATAEWSMRIDTEPMGAGVQELVITLTASENDAPVQRAASVFVKGLQPAHITPDVQTSDDGLLSAIRQVGECKDTDPGRTCLEVEFVLDAPAYLLTFHTRNGKLGVAQCRGKLTERQAGTHGYRLKLPRTVNPGARADLGFYVLAIRSRTIARTLQKHIKNAPGACNGRGVDLIGWFANFERLLDSHGSHVRWQSLHLVNAPAGFARL